MTNHRSNAKNHLLPPTGGFNIKMAPIENDQFREVKQIGTVTHLSKARLGNILRKLGRPDLQRISRGISFLGKDHETTLFAKARQALEDQLENLQPNEEGVYLPFPSGFGCLKIRACVASFGEPCRNRYFLELTTPEATLLVNNHLHEAAYEAILALCLPRQFVEAAAADQKVLIISHHGSTLGEDRSIAHLFALPESPHALGMVTAEEQPAKDYLIEKADRVFIVKFP